MPGPSCALVRAWLPWSTRPGLHTEWIGIHKYDKQFKYLYMYMLQKKAVAIILKNYAYMQV
jgi:hypothetical protein